MWVFTIGIPPQNTHKRQKAPKNAGLRKGGKARISIFHTIILTADELQFNGKKVPLFNNIPTSI